MNNLARTPFSRFGSYVTLKRYDADNPRKPAGIRPGLWIGGVHGFHAVAADSYTLSIGHSVPMTIVEIVQGRVQNGSTRSSGKPR